jgi:HemY protein
MYGAQPAILLFLGKACASIQLWGKAKDYFEQCLAIGPNPEAALEYGKLLESLDNKEAAVKVYKKVLGQM